MLNLKELIILNRNLYFYTRSGYSIEKTLYILSDMKNISNKIKKNSQNILKKLISGKSIYVSFKDSNAVPEYMLHLLKVGEETGNLSKIFAQLLDYYEEKSKKLKEIVNMLTYPCIILFTTIGLFFMMIFYFVPLMSEALSSISSNSQSHPLNKLLWINIFIRRYWMVITLISITIILILSVCILKKNKVYYFILNKFFIIKKVYYKTFCINFFKSLNMLVESGVTLINSIDIIILLEKDPYIKLLLNNVKITLLKGKNFYTSLQGIRVFSNESLNIVKMGEETGTLEESLKNITYLEEQKFKVFIERFFSALHPCIIIILGAFILKILYSILVPLMDAMGGIQ